MSSLIKIVEDYNPRLMANGQIRMMCPFRDNHTDGSGRMSFYMTPEINAFHCFSCGAKGSLIRLLTNKFEVGYYEALELVRLDSYKKEDEVFELDTSWSMSVPDEFKKRGFTAETLKHFRVGVTKDGWIMIPYYDNFNTYSELVGYQKRKYEPARKVINNKGFKKEDYLYNVDKNFSYTILVEGQSDVWRLWSYGYNATAVMGSYLSDVQRDMLLGFKKVYLALDNDIAGRMATEKCYYKLKDHTEVLLVPYTAKDPCEATQDEFRMAVKNSTDYMDYTLSMSMEWDGYLDMKQKALKGYE